MNATLETHDSLPRDATEASDIRNDQSPHLYSMSDLLQLVVSEGSSDLHIRVGIPPVIRVHGVLHRIDGPPLRPEDTEELMRSIASEDNIQQVREKGGADFGFAFGDKARFRVSAFKEKGNSGLVLRQIPTKLLTLEQIGLPVQTIHTLLHKPRGLILVTGPTGSGKTTTLASMINLVNEERDDVHIITIEDPIEYYHTHKKAVVTQREVHVDVPSFAEALRRALRQDPDIILVGELRDLETMEAAITAAETGHLVFGTLHTTGAAKTIDRVVNAFPINQQETIRIQLSTVLQAVISQLLLPRIDKPGRIAAYEIMINTPSIAALIRDNKTFRIQSDIQTGAKYGMVTLDSFLMEKYQDGIIAREEVINKAQDPSTTMQKLAELDAAQAELAEEQPERMAA
jgi:twitching motility protein PilT